MRSEQLATHALIGSIVVAVGVWLWSGGPGERTVQVVYDSKTGTTVDYTRPPAHPSPALASTAYVGVYHNNFFGEITIAAHGGGLVLTQGPHKAPFPLRHFARNVFTYQPVGENAYGLSAVTFTVGAAGKATRVVVENLDIHGQGTFTRVAHPV